MTLHIINQSPQRGDALRDCLSVCRRGDCVLLIEDALELLKEASLVQSLFGLEAQVKVFALLPSGDHHHLSENITKIIQPIDFHGFVSLSAAHAPSVSW